MAYKIIGSMLLINFVLGPIRLLQHSTNCILSPTEFLRDFANNLHLRQLLAGAGGGPVRAGRGDEYLPPLGSFLR